MPSIPPSAEKRGCRGVVFDKDGTLIDLDCFWYGILRHAARTAAAEFSVLEEETALLRLAGFDQAGRSRPGSLIQIGTNEDIAKAWRQYLSGRGVHPPEDFVRRTNDLLSNSSPYGTVKPLADLESLFREIKRRGLYTGVITSDDLIQTEYCLREAGILDYIDSVLAADCGLPPKPAPDLMLALAARWNIPADRILMVGDTENDMIFAKNAGARGVMITPGRPGAGTAFHTLSSLPEVLALL